MNIVHIIPGSGGSFYCGNCLRDSKYYVALREQGHNIIKLPMYLPLFSHEADLGKVPVFYGAVSIYLKQMFPLFEHAPAWVDRLLNSKPLLKLAASQAGSTRAKGLEEMTISMLMGEKGKQHEELDKMTHWLEHNFKPDIIHISNALLLGLAHQLKAKLKCPVVCTLQDEDVWVDVMSPSSRDTVWNLMAERAKDVDLFISVSQYFTTLMRGKLNLPGERFVTLHLGVDPADYHFTDASAKPRTIGYLSRMCHANGIDILIDAFIILKKKPENADIRLLLSGGYTGDDKPILKDIKRQLKQNNLMNDVTFQEDFEDQERLKFLDSISVLSVPVRNGEAFGIYLAEAMASGIPIVQPPLGAFPEIVDLSKGGVIYPENTPASLANALSELLNNPKELSRLSSNAHRSVQERFNIHGLAGELSRIYKVLRKE